MIKKMTQNTLQDHKPDTTTEDEWYRENVVWGFYEEKIPQYIQGKAGESEICSPVTAEDVTRMQDCILKLKKKIKIQINQIEYFKKLNSDRTYSWDVPPNTDVWDEGTSN